MTTTKRKRATNRPAKSPREGEGPTLRGGRVKNIAAIERIIEEAARGFDSLHFGGPLERLVWDVMSPGCSPTEKNTRALAALISGLQYAARVASVDDWGLLCEQIKFYVRNWSAEEVTHSINFTRDLDARLESEVSRA